MLSFVRKPRLGLVSLGMVLSFAGSKKRKLDISYALARSQARGSSCPSSPWAGGGGGTFIA